MGKKFKILTSFPYKVWPNVIFQKIRTFCFCSPEKSWKRRLTYFLPAYILQYLFLRYWNAYSTDIYVFIVFFSTPGHFGLSDEHGHERPGGQQRIAEVRGLGIPGAQHHVAQRGYRTYTNGTRPKRRYVFSSKIISWLHNKVHFDDRYYMYIVQRYIEYCILKFKRIILSTLLVHIIHILYSIV